MSIFKQLFQKGAKRPSAFPEGFEDKFRIFKATLKYIGKEQKRDRRSNSVSLNNAPAPFKDGTKEWLRLEDRALYIRYYDTTTESCESLYVLTLDKTRQAFVLQRKFEFDSAEAAITAFVNIMDEYADAEYMNAVKAVLMDEALLLTAEEDTEPKTEAQPESAQDKDKKTIEPIIK